MCVVAQSLRAFVVGTLRPPRFSHIVAYAAVHQSHCDAVIPLKGNLKESMVNWNGQSSPEMSARSRSTGNRLRLPWRHERVTTWREFMVYYHVRISVEGVRHDEVKTDMNDETLDHQILEPPHAAPEVCEVAVRARGVLLDHVASVCDSWLERSGVHCVRSFAEYLFSSVSSAAAAAGGRTLVETIRRFSNFLPYSVLLSSRS